MQALVSWDFFLKHKKSTNPKHLNGSDADLSQFWDAVHVKFF